MQGSSRRIAASRPALIGMLILVFLLAALTGWIIWRRNRDFSNPDLLKELQKAKLTRNTPVDARGKTGPNGAGFDRTGLSADTDLLSKWPENGTLAKLKVWEAETGPGYSSVAVADGRVYTLFQNGTNEVVVCWQAQTGNELWRFTYDARFSGEYGPGPRSTPTVDGDHVYTVGGTGILHCLKTDPQNPSGEVVWKRDLLQQPIGGRQPRWGVSFSPLVKGDLVYTIPGGPNGFALAALNKLSGDVVWHTGDDEAAYSSPVAVSLAGKKQIIFLTAANVLGVDPKTGKEYWRYPWVTNFDVNSATPIVTSDYVFVSCGYGKGCAVVKISDTGGGQKADLVYSNRNMKNHFSTSVLVGDHLYGFSDTVLTCLNFRTGEVAWKYRHRPTLGKGCLTYSDGYLIMLGERGTLAIAKVTPKEIKVKSSFQLFDRDQRDCWSVPVLAGRLLYVRDQRKIYCLDLRKKE